MRAWDIDEGLAFGFRAAEEGGFVVGGGGGGGEGEAVREGGCVNLDGEGSGLESDGCVVLGDVGFGGFRVAVGEEVKMGTSFTNAL